MKFTQKMHQFITLQTTCDYLYNFLPNKIKTLTWCRSETSIASAHKGVGV